MNNKSLLDALIEHKKEVRKAHEAGKIPPSPSNYIALCIMKIADGLAMKACFRDYPFIEDMKSDGIRNSIEYLHNFDPNKSKNPFAYFTQIIYFAFIRRIDKEKKYLYTKFKAIDNVNTFESASGRHEYDFYEASYSDTIKQSEGTIEYMREFVVNYEEKKRQKDEKKK